MTHYYCGSVVKDERRSRLKVPFKTSLRIKKYTEAFDTFEVGNKASQNAAANIDSIAKYLADSQYYSRLVSSQGVQKFADQSRYSGS